jgi:hypothetical protein
MTPFVHRYARLTNIPDVDHEYTHGKDHVGSTTVHGMIVTGVFVCDCVTRFGDASGRSKEVTRVVVEFGIAKTLFGGNNSRFLAKFLQSFGQLFWNMMVVGHP